MRVSNSILHGQKLGINQATMSFQDGIKLFAMFHVMLPIKQFSGKNLTISIHNVKSICRDGILQILDA